MHKFLNWSDQTKESNTLNEFRNSIESRFSRNPVMSCCPSGRNLITKLFEPLQLRALYLVHVLLGLNHLVQPRGQSVCNQGPHAPLIESLLHLLHKLIHLVSAGYLGGWLDLFGSGLGRKGLTFLVLVDYCSNLRGELFVLRIVLCLEPEEVLFWETLETEHEDPVLLENYSGFHSHA